MENTISDRCEVLVRFNEADPLGNVWHGHYIRYFEDGRESFGKTHGCRYLDFYKNNIVVPVINVQCDYKKSLRYGDSVIIETIYVPSPAAKMIFNYNLYNKTTGELVATGSSTQVFLDEKTSVLQLTRPVFFENWLDSKGLL